MIEWASPWWFLALPVALAAPWLTGRPAVAFSALSLLEVRRTVRLMVAWLPSLLSSLGLALLVVALARPQLIDRERVIETEGLDIFVVLDTSGSMEIEDYTYGQVGQPCVKSKCSGRLLVAVIQNSEVRLLNS